MCVGLIDLEVRIMADSTTYWLNVDNPTKIARLHRKGCRHELAKRETSFKGINQLKKDGGWLHFERRAQAGADVRTHHKGFQLRDCKDCL